MRTLSVMGDSISTFSGCNPEGWAVYYTDERAGRAGLAGAGDTWWSLTARHLGFRVLSNASYSGSMVAGSGFPAASSVERAAALCAAGEAPDAVVVFIGINDYGWGGSRAQAAAHSSAAPACSRTVPFAVAGAAAPDALDEFSASYDAMLANVRAACPDAEVRCCTVPAGRLEGSAVPTFASDLRGVPLASYNAAIRAVASARGCAVLDLAGSGLDYESVDGTHPTALGMRQIAEMAVSSWEGRPLDRRAFDEGGPFGPRGGVASWASGAPCPDGPCVGCPWARDTSNTWSCVCERGGDGVRFRRTVS